MSLTTSSSFQQRLCASAPKPKARANTRDSFDIMNGLDIRARHGIDLVYQVHDLAEEARRNGLLLAADLLDATARRLTLALSWPKSAA